MTPKRIIISRTDSIGDVVLTLPMAGVIKSFYPNCKIFFLGRTYTQPIVNTSIHVDEFINWDTLQKEANPIEALKKYNTDTIIHVFPNKDVARLAFKAKIPNRIGTRGRVFHVLNCNKKVAFSRRKSDLHESQLNLKLLFPFKIDRPFSLKEIEGFYGLNNLKTLPVQFSSLIDADRINVILHPKSKGSAKEWGLDKFAELIEVLPENQFKIFITGTKDEGELIGDALPFNKSNVVSLIGKMNLDELISFIAQSDALVAASTGPLHIAAATGIKAVGLYSPKRPIHPGRWQPVGAKSIALVKDESCPKCLAKEDCNCISDISPSTVMKTLLS